LLHILPHEIAKIIFLSVDRHHNPASGGTYKVAKLIYTVLEDICRALADFFIKTQTNRQSVIDNWNRRPIAGSL